MSHCIGKMFIEISAGFKMLLKGGPQFLWNKFWQLHSSFLVQIIHQIISYHITYKITHLPSDSGEHAPL